MTAARVRLTARWEVTTEHSQSCSGKPVLVDRRTGAAYGPGDPVRMAPRGPLLPAAEGVRRRLVARRKKLPVAGRALAEQFVALAELQGEEDRTGRLIDAMMGLG